MENGSNQKNFRKGIGNFIKKMFSYKWVRVLTVIILIIILLNIVLSKLFGDKLLQMQQAAIQTEIVEKRDIEKVLSSSGTIQPLNTYEVTTLVDGEVIAANFEEGDQVEEGDVLYQITTDSLDTKIESAQASVEKARRAYERALKSSKDASQDYERATKKMGSVAIESEVSGVITELSVKVGDTIQQGSQIGKVYDNSSMLLEVPFPSTDVSSSLIGKKASVEIDESGETLIGIVTEVSALEVSLSGNRVTKTVTIEVKNPGGITASTTATAMIGSLSSSEEGTFTAIEDTVLIASNSGEISELKVSKGDRIRIGDIILVLDKESVTDQITSYENALDNANYNVEDAEDGIRDAENNLQEQIDLLTDYSIKAPISGQVISKNTLVGDTIKSSSMNGALCIIYDLSAVTFEMFIDELDIMSIEVGQMVNITADALEGIEITGVVTNISLESITSGGVTQYPVTVRIDDVGNLLPGMNVTGEIIIEKAENVIALPVDALMRGNVAYVKDDSVLEAKGDIPAGFRETEVEIGISDGDYIQITSGIEENQEVYVVREGNGIQMLIPGMEVTPMDGQGPNDGFQGNGQQERGGNGSGPPSR